MAFSRIRPVVEGLSTRPCCELWGRTELMPKVAYHLPSRRDRSSASQPPYAPLWGTKAYSTFHAMGTSDKRQAEIAPMVHEIMFSADQPSDLPERTAKILSTWELTASRKGLMRRYNFKSFAKAWEFMSAVTAEIKLKKHHPSWSNKYDQVTIEWTTHKPEGLSVKDVEMAEKCDCIASKIGIQPVQSPSPGTMEDRGDPTLAERSEA